MIFASWRKRAPKGGVLGVLGPQLLEGNVPAQVAVVSQPEATDAAGRVQVPPAIALAPERERGRWSQTATQPRVLPPASERWMSSSWMAASERLMSSGMAARLAWALPPCFCDSALQEILNVGPVGRLDPASPQEQIGEAFILARGPEQACLNELRGVDQLRLQSEHPEQQIAVGVHEG